MDSSLPDPLLENHNVRLGVVLTLRSGTSSTPKIIVVQIIRAFERENIREFSKMASAIGGYDATFIEPLDKDLECPVCLFALKEPLQTSCGHLICKTCADRITQYVDSLAVNLY